MIFKKISTFFVFLTLFFSSFVQVEGKDYQVAFYSDFEPISYSANRDPSAPEFNHAKGYEVDLLKAMQAIPGSNMTFVFHGVKKWDNIWLSPYTNTKIDIAIGGISREDRRLLNKEGKQVLANTHKTTQFKQSLLMNAKESTHIKKHEDLTCAYVIGAVRGTTGEYRYLVQANIIEDLDKGQIKKGITVVLEDKSFITSNGYLSIHDPKITTRSMLIPPDCSLPITKYFVAEDSMIPALKDGYIDAIARGYIGNKLVADKSNGKFTVNAIYSLECPKQESITCSKSEESVFFVKIENKELIDKLNQYIDYLTDNGKIDYDAWTSNNNVFMERAKNYEKK
jgi:ABC-type amino acid transport substrate-binding protein